MTKVIPDKVAESETSKGKGFMNEDEQIEGHKNNIIVKEGQEFLKLIKKSDFKIIYQLGQTPSKTSILYLLLSFDSHPKTLLKFLNTAHMCKTSHSINLMTWLLISLPVDTWDLMKLSCL